MSEQFLAVIIQILIGLGSVLGAVAVYTKESPCQPNPHNGANCTDLSSEKIEWNYHFG